MHARKPELHGNPMTAAGRRLILAIISVALLALLWRLLIDDGLGGREQIVAMLDQAAGWRESGWLVPTLILAYLMLVPLVFPLTVLVLVTGSLLDPWTALFCATVGTLGASTVSYFLGRRLGREAIERHGGRRVRAAEAFMQDNAMHSMIVINLLPIAPFTMTNMLAGAFHMRFGAYLVGSAIGIVPGLLVVILVGGQATSMLRASSAAELWQAAAIALLAVVALGLVILGVRRYAASDRDRRPPSGK